MSGRWDQGFFCHHVSHAQSTVQGQVTGHGNQGIAVSLGRENLLNAYHAGTTANIFDHKVHTFRKSITGNLQKGTGA